MKISTRLHRTDPAAASPTPDPPSGNSVAIGGDELRARTYVKAALGETDTHPPAWWSTHSAQESEPATAAHQVEVHHHHYYAETQSPAPARDRLISLAWVVADKPRLAAVAAGALPQPAFYALAQDAGTLAPVGMAFMAGMVTGYWRMSHPNVVTRWLFVLNISAAVFYAPTFLPIVAALTGVS
ncbi:hypothetical protein AB0D66_28255 [Streptomyces sp. NPDC048270]|uniref:hypothetical protein n=1 Tax=Streptomyces sp. NPDC048270 TaxID=3154615 RepID=UPI0034087329